MKEICLLTHLVSYRCVFKCFIPYVSYFTFISCLLFHVPGCIIHQDTSNKPSAAKLFIQVSDEPSIPCSNKFVNMFIQLFRKLFIHLFDQFKKMGKDPRKINLRRSLPYFLKYKTSQVHPAEGPCVLKPTHRQLKS